MAHSPLFVIRLFCLIVPSAAPKHNCRVQRSTEINFPLKASPGRGKLSPQVTDEGADKQLLPEKYPSSGATRHLLPLLSLCDIFPRTGEICPQGVKAFAPGQTSKVDFRGKGAQKNGAAAPLVQQPRPAFVIKFRPFWRSRCCRTPGTAQSPPQRGRQAYRCPDWRCR